jgi:hypothetical protein
VKLFFTFSIITVLLFNGHFIDSAYSMGAKKSKKKSVKNNNSNTKNTQSPAKKSSSTPNPTSSSTTSNASRRPQVGEKFQYQLNGSIKNLSVNVVFLDLFDTSNSKIQELKNQGKKVICYFSAGTAERWRNDFSSIPSNIQGNAVEGWENERWLNLRDNQTVSLAKNRISLAQAKKCDGVDPDNVDGYDNNTGFNLSKNDVITFLNKIASDAHSKNLFIGMKNGVEIASTVSSFMDWVVSEECFANNECSGYKPFIQKSKAVFIVEYTSKKSSQCSDAQRDHMSLIFNRNGYELNGNIDFCP